MYIVDVNSDNKVERYNNLIKRVPSIVLFYADWCGHCNNFKPEWKKFERLARQQHKDNDFMLARVNHSYINEIDGYSSVDGYPTIYHLVNGKHNKNFSNNRDVNGLIEFLMEVHPGINLMNGGKRSKKNKRTKRRRKNKRSRTVKKGDKSKKIKNKGKSEKKESLIHRLLRYEIMF